MRKFKPPACLRVWESKMGIGADRLPDKKIWKRKSTFSTPRDRIPGLKLLHRNLYVAGNDLNDNQCRACTERESQLHLCECNIIRDEFWEPLIRIATSTGMQDPQDKTVWIATGAYSTRQDGGLNKVTSPNYAIYWDIGWRCLYAAIVKSRIEQQTLDLEKALARTIAMTISRLRAYGGRWKEWVRNTDFQTQPKIIGEKHQRKGLINQSPDGPYQIHDALIDAAKQLDLM